MTRRIEGRENDARSSGAPLRPGQPERLLDRLRAANRGIAVAIGVLLAANVLFVIVDVAARAVGSSLGGSDELSGYTMAIAATWGLSFALTEMAHVRIDLIRARLARPARIALDLISLLATAGVALVIAFRGWDVLEKSLARGSRANTTLETPLWIPQSLWFAGWCWFAVTAVLLAVAGSLLLRAREADTFERRFGIDEGL